MLHTLPNSRRVPITLIIGLPFTLLAPFLQVMAAFRLIMRDREVLARAI